MDVLVVAPHCALIPQGALGALCHPFSRLRLCWLALVAGLLCVGAEVCGVQAVPCGQNVAVSLSVDSEPLLHVLYQDGLLCDQ